MSNNTQLLLSIVDYAGELLSPWEEINFNQNSITFLYTSKPEEINAPTQEDHQRIKQQREDIEETQYNSIVEAKGLFDYDENHIDEYPYSLIRAIQYTEMISKALPAFSSNLKLAQKQQLIEAIYSYPHKIVYAMLKPIDEEIEMICDELSLTKDRKAENRQWSI